MRLQTKIGNLEAQNCPHCGGDMKSGLRATSGQNSEETMIYSTFIGKYLFDSINISDWSCKYASFGFKEGG